MPRIPRLLPAALALIVWAAPAQAQFGNSLRGTRVALNVGLPMGKFDEVAKTGFGVVLQQTVGDDMSTWYARGNFGFDYFKGNVTYDNIQFITTGLDLVHRSSDAFYQFGGLGLSSVRFTYVGGGPGMGSGRNEQDFLLTGGVGVNFGRDDGTKWFLEFAATTAFTTGGNSAWFPVRIGLRF